MSRTPKRVNPKRPATHAGSWYSRYAEDLEEQLDTWLSDVETQPDKGVPSLPIETAKAVIAPHAGLSYSGKTAAWAYKCIDPSKYKRVFILGPSHHYHLDGCALSTATAYETPLGDLPLDVETIKELRLTKQFENMNEDEDKEEHSIELHLPYVRRVWAKHDIKIVPILVGQLTYVRERDYGKLLAPYFKDPSTFFIISSDFCHWGIRFRYTHYYPSLKVDHAINLKSRTEPSDDVPIHVSIAHLDRLAMSAIAFPSPASDSLFSKQSLPPASECASAPPTPAGSDTEGAASSAAARDAKRSHKRFNAYLKETRNTVCGRHPIGVLLGTLRAIEKEEVSSAAGTGSGEKWGMRLTWLQYDQSEPVRESTGSSVSYASGVVKATRTAATAKNSDTEGYRVGP